jgi:hypothetical protein
MRTKILKLLGACAAAASFAMPAAAFTVSLDVVGQNLQVNLVGLGTDTINTYDVYLNYDPMLFGDITGVDQSSVLGDPLDAGQTLAFTDFSTPGLIEGYLISYVPNATLLGEPDPLLLFTVHFGALADLTTANFALGATTFGCAAVDPTGGNNPNSSVECGPGTNVPEPASLALVALALAGAGFARRRSA